jgi:hypothetical protein
MEIRQRLRYVEGVPHGAPFCITERFKSMRNSPPPDMEWKVVGNHVLPVDDLREHSMVDCWCRPFDDEGAIIHNSLDHREFYERGERKPS